MSRWKALPAQLDPRARQLVVRLRRLKDHSGLSMRQLAARTGYSPKSWERYLGGRSLPPRDAVEAIARIGGEEPTRLLALHEVAAQAWGDRPTGGPEAVAAEPVVLTASADVLTAGTEVERSPGHALRVGIVAGAVILVLAVSAAVLVTVRIMDDNDNGKPAAAAPFTASPRPSPPAYACHLKQADGRWYAGNSRTLDTGVAYGSGGPEVAEAQCLLRRAGFSPGGIDGMFGPLTQGAVKSFQKHAGLDVDGMVGPHTWKALRG